MGLPIRQRSVPPPRQAIYLYSIHIQKFYIRTWKQNIMMYLHDGVYLLTVVMILWNYLITPMYMGVARSDVAALLLPAILPFNVLKVGFNSALTLALYKPLVTALRKTGLVDGASKKSGSSKLGIYLLALGILSTCVLALLALRGIL